MTPRVSCVALGLTVVLGLTMACSLLSTGPAATVSRFYGLLEKGKIEDAQKLLSSRVVGQLGTAKMRAALEAGAQDISKKQGIRDIKVQKEEIQGDLASVTVLITYGNGSTDTENAKLVKERGSWKLDISK